MIQTAALAASKSKYFLANSDPVCVKQLWPVNQICFVLCKARLNANVEGLVGSMISVEGTKPVEVSLLEVAVANVTNCFKPSTWREVHIVDSIEIFSTTVSFTYLSWLSISKHNEA